MQAPPTSAEALPAGHAPHAPPPPSAPAAKPRAHRHCEALVAPGPGVDVLAGHATQLVARMCGWNAPSGHKMHALLPAPAA